MEADTTLMQRRSAVDGACEALTGIDSVLHQASGSDLGPLFRKVDDLARRVEAARVAILSEAMERGEATSTLARAHVGWVIEWAPSLRAGGASRLVAVVAASREERCVQLRAALLEGRVDVGNAAVCLGEMARMEVQLTPEAVPTVWTGLLDLASEHGPREIRALRPRLMAAYGRAGLLDRDQSRAKMLVSLSQPLDGGDGLFDYRLRLDVEGMAVVEAALGPLAAPRPADGVADLRPSGQRRGDALIELLRRAVASPEGVATTAKATLFVTVDIDDLTDEVGSGTTLGGGDAGAVLAPGVLRRLACDAGLLPTVLGGPSHVLDLGLGTRLFTPAQLGTLWIRDGSCSIPGCTVPPQWADGHHLIHWADGGPTDLDNAALLCGYHHTWVHEKRLAGRLVDGRVAWDLVRGSYDLHLAQLRASGRLRPGRSPKRGTKPPPPDRR